MTFTPETIHPDTWPAVCAVLRRAVERGGRETIASVIDGLLDHTNQLWVKRSEGGDPIAVAVTELVNAPYGPVVCGKYLAGHGMADWLDECLETVADHARKIGARGIEVRGRKGWERMLSSRGWAHSATIMARAI